MIHVVVTCDVDASMEAEDRMPASFDTNTCVSAASPLPLIYLRDEKKHWLHRKMSRSCPSVVQCGFFLCTSAVYNTSTTS